MNDSFINMMISHNNKLNEAVNTIIRNKYLNVMNEGNDCRYNQIVPEKSSCAKEEIIDLDNLRYMIPNNKKCCDTYHKCDTNPIGMIVPRIDIKNGEDMELKLLYDKMRVILHDKYDKCVQEGGEGWLKFIDTLATPKEKAENYKLIDFRSIFTDFITDKKIEKVSRLDLEEAVKVLDTFGTKLNELIDEASIYDEEYNKKRCLFNEQEDPLEFEASISRLAEAVLIIEEDYINMQSIEARKQILIEQAKSAYKILYSISTYNPRDIKNSSVNLEFNISMIESKFNAMIENPTALIVESEISDSILKVKTSLVSSNDKFLKKYKEPALNSKCIGIYINQWKDIKDVSKDFWKTMMSIDNNFDPKKLVKLELPKLKEKLDYLDNINSSILSGNTSSLSPEGKKIVELISYEDDENKIFDISSNKKITVKDVKNAVSLLEDIGYDIDILVKNNINLSKGSADIFVGNTFGKSEKERMIKRIAAVREKIIGKLAKTHAKIQLRQLKEIQARSRAVLLHACRTPKESMKEQAAEVISLIPVYEQLINLD